MDNFLKPRLRIVTAVFLFVFLIGFIGHLLMLPHEISMIPEPSCSLHCSLLVQQPFDLFRNESIPLGSLATPIISRPSLLIKIPHPPTV